MRFALVFVVAWSVTVVLPRLVAPPALQFRDAIVLLPLGLAVLSLLSQERARFWLQLFAIPVSFAVAGALAAPKDAPSSAAWTVMAAVVLFAYWLWTLHSVAQKKVLDLETIPLNRSSLVPPPVRFWRKLALPLVGGLSMIVVFIIPPLFAGVERRAFVLSLSTAFVLIAHIGGVTPMLRVQKRLPDRKEVVRRAVIMTFYALACLAIYWGYSEFRR